MTRDECINKQNEFREVEHHRLRFIVTPTGVVKSWNTKTQSWQDRPWRHNADGYWVVSGYGTIDNKVKFMTVGVHILVAKAWVQNPHNKPEVNHLDFNRENPLAYNLEWVTHQENVAYSRKANRYPVLSGELNPNYGNDTLHKRYERDKEFAKAKQSRPGGRNGKAKPCRLIDQRGDYIGVFDYQRGAVEYLVNTIGIAQDSNHEQIIRHLRGKTPRGSYYGYTITIE